MQSILQTWLARQCGAGEDSPCATLWARKNPESPPERLAVHPPTSRGGGETHAAAAAAALGADRAVLRAGEETDLLAAPGRCAGLQVAAVIEQPKRSPREHAAALDALERSIGWLDFALRLPGAPEGAPTADTGGGPSPARTLDLLAIALEPRPMEASALALTTELASLLGCERVSLARLERDELGLEAISHTAALDTRSRLARELVAAMQEALDQDAVVVHPSVEDETPLAVAAHLKLAEAQGLDAVWTFPLRDDEAFCGVLLVEFSGGQPSAASTRAWLEQLTSLLAPVLGLRWRDEAAFGERVRRLLRDELPTAIGLERVNVRLGLGVAALVLLGLALLPATHRVAAPAELEGVVQRAIVAPMPAFVAESRRRAGDVVEKGEVLGALEDADLKLEARKWEAKREQRRKELRAAMAERDRAQVRILQAQVEQADAELSLIAEQRRRTRLVAPFDGVVTRGDLSQALGSPVERGEVLFEVAPENDYRVILEVDGRDIAFVEPGQAGRLTLQALPGEAKPFAVSRVTPISSSEDGRSFFRVEASLGGSGGGLRPGMDGVAKIDVGHRSVLWIWTHSAVDWLRMAWWAWVP